jgi:hypothetical protein
LTPSTLRSRANVVALTPWVVDRATALARTHVLRGYDAVQLASALCLGEEHGISPLTLVSADDELNAAAAAEAMEALNPAA